MVARSLYLDLDAAIGSGSSGAPQSAKRWHVRVTPSLPAGAKLDASNALRVRGTLPGDHFVFERVGGATKERKLDLSLDAAPDATRVRHAVVEAEDGTSAVLIPADAGQANMLALPPTRAGYEICGSYWRELLDRESTSVVAGAREMMFEIDKLVSTKILTAPTVAMLADIVKGNLAHRVMVRATPPAPVGAALANGDPPPNLALPKETRADFVTAIEALGKVQAAIYVRPGFEDTLEAFANGDLRFEYDADVPTSRDLHMALDVEELCQPDSSQFFSFAEFALVWLSLERSGHIVAAPEEVANWLDWARVLVRCQEIFTYVYRPCACSGFQSGEVGLADYMPSNYRGWKRVSRGHRLALRRIYGGFDLDALDQRATENIRLAAGGGRCGTEIADLCGGGKSPDT